MRVLALAALCACTPSSHPADSGGADSGGADSGVPDAGFDPFGDEVVSFTPGEGAGFGQDALPDVVLGSPEGGGAVGSTHVVSLGRDGEIVIAFTDFVVVDGDGPDLLVFENPFPGWLETGRVAVSDDLQAWHEWPCAADDADGGFGGCAGVRLVYASSDNGVDATEPDAAGGDAFDLAELGVSRARYVRIRDSGVNTYDGNTGGFDLDAVAVVNGVPAE